MSRLDPNVSCLDLTPLRVRAAAKVNLYLEVLSRRSDGYHEIETLFERVSLCDELTFTPSERGIRILTDSKALPRGRGNLIFRAAELLARTAGVRRGAVIRLKKNIPIAAGLGGGSSDAASTLVGLNRLWGLGLSRTELLKLGALLGSDVPFFLVDCPLAIGRGRGEVLKKLPPPPRPIWHVIVKPSVGLSTRAAYERLDSSLLTPQKSDVRMLLQSIRKGRLKALGGLLKNRLELTINDRVREIFGIKKELCRVGALGAVMSGSGSAFFGIFSSRSKAYKAASRLKRKTRWKVFVASTL